MDETHYSLKKLSELSEIEARTIRWYISEGLLRGPETRGRGAYYTEHHLKRLKTIRLLKDFYRMPLERIRKYLLMARDDEDIEVVPVNLIEADSGSLATPTSADDRVPTARDRMAWRREAFLQEQVSFARLREEEDLAQQLPPTPLDCLLAQLRETIGNRPLRPRARGTEATHIDITPDIGLVLRGAHPPREIAQFEQLADYLREILLGGIGALEGGKQPDKSAE